MSIDELIMGAALSYYRYTCIRTYTYTSVPLDVGYTCTSAAVRGSAPSLICTCTSVLPDVDYTYLYVYFRSAGRGLYVYFRCSSGLGTHSVSLLLPLWYEDWLFPMLNYLTHCLMPKAEAELLKTVTMTYHTPRSGDLVQLADFEKVKGAQPAKRCQFDVLV